jgi:hypothetical protein
MVEVFGLAVLGAVSAFILKAFGWRGAPLIVIGALLAIFSRAADGLGELLSVFEAVGEVEGAMNAARYLLKILGLGYLSGICSDFCRELGEAGIASAVNLVARIESLVIISPLVSEIITLALELVE